MKIEKTVNELLALNSVMNEMSRRKVPFGITLAKNLKILKIISDEFDALKKELVDGNALLDENGIVLGKIIPPAKEGEESPGRVQNPQTFDQIDWANEGGMQTVLTKLNTLGENKREIILYPIDVERTYFDTNIRQKVKVREYIDKELESSLILYLDEMEMLKNLYVDDDDESDPSVQNLKKSE